MRTRALKFPIAGQALHAPFEVGAATRAFATAGAQLEQFQKAAGAELSAPLSRAERIRRDMEEWRKKNEGRDFWGEM